MDYTSEKGNTAVTLLAIFLAAVLMFFIPMMATAENQDKVTQLALQTAVEKFVTNVTTKGYISREDYDAFCSEIGATGNTYDIQIEVQHLDENPGKKYVITSGDLIGENVRYSTFTSAILEELEETGDGKYELKTGDNVIVTVNNTSTTMAELFKNFVYKLSGKDSSKIGASTSAMVVKNGN